MQVIGVRNVGQGLPEALRQLMQYGVPRQSRNGEVLEFPVPVTTVYRNPRERVLFWPQRDANPFFHFFESLWMLNGGRDVNYVAKFVTRMRSFSDDGKTFNGAYGYRWRRHFGLDQLNWVVSRLKTDPNDRRVVLSMWDGSHDPYEADNNSKDVPCNTHIYFRVSGRGLDMTVCCRSNDLIWGCYGANAVHFSMLQEYVASSLGIEVGCYWQVSNNLHAYRSTLDPLLELIDYTADGFSALEPSCMYSENLVVPYNLMSVDSKIWLQDLEVFIQDPEVIGFRDPFFRRVAKPMYMAHKAWQENKSLEGYEHAKEIIYQCGATDWLLASAQWLDRRKDRLNASGTNGS